MINGEPRTGITFFQFSAGVDNGPIVGQLATDIHPQDTIATLYDRIEGLGFELLRVYLPKLADGSVELISQDDSKRRLFPQRSPEDGKIDWSQLAQHTHNFIRAQTKPYPGAFTLLGEDKITVWASRLTDRVCDLLLSPGELGATGDRVFVGCGGGTVIEITHIEKNGIEVPVHVWYCGLKKSGGVYVFQYSTAQR
jgi:methionyl-tRNA formyltransferase